MRVTLDLPYKWPWPEWLLFFFPFFLCMVVTFILWWNKCTTAQCEISLQIFRSQKSCQMKGNWVLKKRGVINLKIWDKMQLLFSIYEFYSKVGVKLEILTPNMMILNFAFLSYDCLNIWKNWFIKTLITCFFLNLLQRSQHRKFLWMCIKNF